MERGVIDGGVQGITSYTKYGYWDIAPYVLAYDFYTISGLTSVNLKKFKGLPSSLQEKLLELGARHEDWVTEYWTGIRKDIADKMAQHKVNYVNLSKAEKQAMEAPVKILLPLILFIFPTIFIIIFGPIAIKLLRH